MTISIIKLYSENNVSKNLTFSQIMMNWIPKKKRKEKCISFTMILFI